MTTSLSHLPIKTIEKNKSIFTMQEMKSFPKHRKRWSISVLILEFSTIAILFQKILPSSLKVCTTCTSQNTILTYLGIGYMTLLTVISQLFPGFPRQRLARIGFIWAILLGISLTAIRFPQWCIACLIAHVCHILVWLIWNYAPFSKHVSQSRSLLKQLCLLSILPISVIGMILYSITDKPSSISTTGLNLGEFIPKTSLTLNSQSERSLLINFISSDCPFCKIQLPLISELSKDLDSRFIFIAPKLTEELKAYAPNIEWIEDPEGILHEEFEIFAHPTLFVVNPDGKISQIVSGIPKDVKKALLLHLKIEN